MFPWLLYLRLFSAITMLLATWTKKIIFKVPLGAEIIIIEFSLINWHGVFICQKENLECLGFSDT